MSRSSEADVNRNVRAAVKMLIEDDELILDDIADELGVNRKTLASSMARRDIFVRDIKRDGFYDGDYSVRH
jgi:hypothetical protein